MAIVGRPNVGKSSTLNALLGQKISIVSPKPQTTRNKIMGISTNDAVQLIFLDTPGVHCARNKLGERMQRAIRESVAQVDACLMVTEAGVPVHQHEIGLMEKFKKMQLPAVLALNKIDKVREKTSLLNNIKAFSGHFEFDAVVPMSAKTGEGVERLQQELRKLAKPAQHIFDEDDVTDQQERVLVGEIIREKILKLTDHEIPHGIAVSVESMRERSNAKGQIVDIDAIIYCEKTSHKGILIGKSGENLKKIATLAREDMEDFLQIKANLQLWIKVKDDWRNRPELFRDFGFDSPMSI